MYEWWTKVWEPVHRSLVIERHFLSVPCLSSTNFSGKVFRFSTITAWSRFTANSIHPSKVWPFSEFQCKFFKMTLSLTSVHFPALRRVSLPYWTPGVPLINKQLLLFFSKPVSHSSKDLEMIIVNPNKTLFQTSSNFSSLQPVKLLLPPFPLIL